ncbi:hypothetical protein VITFI_CDS0142 [Vitreoscilla filiformis]|uniref:Uncharacterized protein n=1 Tax=Vitreoscilla filiformis TaxID=63 RepID=A0A221KA71_VITFI|nr:hypothetical protein VITFI_CDS0142 [Vitreoscilla filiformis]
MDNPLVPQYEVRGTWVYRFMAATQPVYEIRGRLVYAFGNALQPLYEIR